HHRLLAPPRDRAAPPRTTKGGCYARAKRAKTGVVGDPGVSSVGDVDQLQGSRQLDHILVSRELLFTATRLLNEGKDLASCSGPGEPLGRPGRGGGAVVPRGGGPLPRPCPGPGPPGGWTGRSSRFPLTPAWASRCEPKKSA